MERDAQYFAPLIQIVLHMVDYSINRFTGRWKSESGHSIKIDKISDTQASVSFFGIDGKPPLRPYFNNLPTVDMTAYYDDYMGTFEVELWTKEKGFMLGLTHEHRYELDESNRESLVPAISRYEEDDFLDEYYKLFGPLQHFTKNEGRTTKD